MTCSGCGRARIQTQGWLSPQLLYSTAFQTRRPERSHFTILRGVASSVGSPTVPLKPSPSTPRTVSGPTFGPSPHGQVRLLGCLEENLLLPSSMSPGYCLLRVGKRPACMAG